MDDPLLTTLQPGTVIGGKYEVVKCLGAGSMGMVYACRHRELQGQLVAAKVLFSQVASDSVAAARFKNEVLASYGVSHPNVVRAYEFIKDGDIIAYTMEFVGGGDLADRMSRSDLATIPEIIKLLCQMTAGVQAIHDAGIVHRDLKPENILLTKEGNVKIADFGIARKNDGPKLTEHGGVVGTLEYVSPEYMLRSQVDWRSDIYALGVLAYELITGDSPFKGDSAYASISKRLQNDPEPPSRYRRECSPKLDQIILRSLARDPEERYQSAVEMFYDLQIVAAELGTSNSSAVGVLIPPPSSIEGKRYVGPSLTKTANGASDQVAETQLLTSDGSIDYSGSGDAWRRGGRVVSTSDHALGVDGRERISTDYLGPIGSESVGRLSEQGSLARVSSLVRESDNLVSASGTDSAAAWSGSAARSYRSGSIPTDLIKRGQARLKVLDLFIMLFAALSGVGCGYIFLKLFAPSFLDRL